MGSLRTLKVVFDRSGNYPDCLVSWLKLERYSDSSEEAVLFYGYSTFDNDTLLEGYASCKKKFYLDLHSPCGLYDSDAERERHLRLGQRFDKVFTICPYTAEYFNKYFGNDKYVPVMFPYNEDYGVSGSPEKEVDLLYWGGVTSPTHAHMLKTCAHEGHTYNYFRLSDAGHRAPLDTDGKDLSTGVDVPRQQLWETLRKTKIMLVSNVLHLSEKEALSANSLPDKHNNAAFSELDKYLLPQIKTRPIEAAMNKTLILCKRDPWSVLDHWFTPGEDFVYYDTNEELPNKVSEILNNWEDYQPMIESAYTKAKKYYTSEKLIQKMKEFC